MREGTHFFVGTYQSERAIQMLETRRAETGRDHLVTFFAAEPEEAVLGRALYFL